MTLDGNAYVADSSGWHGMRQSLYCIPVSRRKRGKNSISSSGEKGAEMGA